MLTAGDEYPIHQTPEPIAFSGSDRNFYDRFFFNGYSADGETFFAAAMGIYPHLNIIDAAVSILRVSVVVTVVAPSVIAGMVLPALAALACFAAVGALLLQRPGSLDSGETPARNPFELMPLFAFALLFTLVAAASAALAGNIGSSGLLATATVSGLFDVDVAVLSTLRLVGQVIEPGLASTLVLAALAANALGRLSLAFVAGPPSYSLPLAAATAAAIASGYAMHTLLPALAALP